MKLIVAEIEMQFPHFKDGLWSYLEKIWFRNPLDFSTAQALPYQCTCIIQEQELFGEVFNLIIWKFHEGDQNLIEN